MTMPRAKLQTPTGPRLRGESKGLPHQSTGDAIRSIGEYHISAVRRKRNGDITQVRHIAYGWMTVKEWYVIDEFHKMMPVIQEVVHGGYQLNAWVMSVEIPVGIPGFTAGIPLSVVLLSSTVVLLIADNYTGQPKWMMLLDVLWPFLPFGVLWPLLRISQLFIEAGKDVKGSFQNPVFDGLISLMGGGGLLLGVAEALGYSDLVQWVINTNTANKTDNANIQVAKDRLGGNPRPSWWPGWLPW